MELEIQRVWLIECWRCSATADDIGTREQALATFRAAGWAKVGNGYQMCPKCSGQGPA